MLEGNTHLVDMAQRKEGENRRGYGRHFGAHAAGNKKKLSRRGIWFTSLTPVLTTCHDLMSMECTGGNCCHCRFALTLNIQGWHEGFALWPLCTNETTIT